MALYKLHDFDPSYRDSFDGDDVKGLDVYAEASDEKIGTIHDALVDEQGTFRYLIIDMGFWVFGKKVMLPIGQSRIDYNNRRVYARMTKEQAESLPEFTNDLKLDYDYEENVRDVYRPSIASTAAATGVAGLSQDSSYVAPGTAPVDTTATGALIDQPGYVSSGSDFTTDRTTDANRPNLGDRVKNAVGNVGDRITGRDYDRDTYSYDRDPGLYGINDRDHQNIRLYQERLLANKQRQKTGEVAVGKHVETETQRVSVPVEKERVVVERVNVTDTTAVAPGTVDFHEGEVARMEVYEETADIQKEAFVREEVRVRKEVDRETVEAEETLRREELDIDTQGNPVINRNID